MLVSGGIWNGRINANDCATLRSLETRLLCRDQQETYREFAGLLMVVGGMALLGLLVAIVIRAWQRQRTDAKFDVAGTLTLIGALVPSLDKPTFGGDAYTEIVSQIATGTSATLFTGSLICFATGAVLRALSKGDAS